MNSCNNQHPRIKYIGEACPLCRQLNINAQVINDLLRFKRWIAEGMKKDSPYKPIFMDENFEKEEPKDDVPTGKTVPTGAGENGSGPREVPSDAKGEPPAPFGIS